MNQNHNHLCYQLAPSNFDFKIITKSKIFKAKMKDANEQDLMREITDDKYSVLCSDNFSHRVSKRITQLCSEDSSFEGLKLYSFRHTLVTKVAEKFGIYMASKIAGHKSVKTTEKFYVRPSDEKIRECLQESLLTRDIKPKMTLVNS